MKHLNVLFEKLHIPADIIDAVGADELPNDFDQRVENYNNSRIDYFKATPEFKNLMSEREGTTYKGALLKHIKRMNSAIGMGLSNQEMEEFKTIDDFMTSAKNFIDENASKLIKSTDEQLKKDLEKYKNDYTAAIKSNQEIQEQIVKIREEANTQRDAAIDLYKAETLFHKLVSEDATLPGTDGQAYTLELIKKDIFDNYTVKGDGTILSKDGTSAIHPEKQTVIKSLSEIYEYLKNKANLVKRSNAGSGAGAGAGSGSASGVSASIQAKMEELRKARLQ